MLTRLVHSRNAPLPMLVTLAGITTLVRLALPSKALAPMPVTGRPSMVSGMITAPPGPV